MADQIVIVGAGVISGKRHGPGALGPRGQAVGLRCGPPVIPVQPKLDLFGQRAPHLKDGAVRGPVCPQVPAVVAAALVKFLNGPNRDRVTLHAGHSVCLGWDGKTARSAGYSCPDSVQELVRMAGRQWVRGRGISPSQRRRRPLHSTSGSAGREWPGEWRSAHSRRRTGCSSIPRIPFPAWSTGRWRWYST